MAVKIRMTRMGRRHRPFFRINAVESRTPRDGAILERLGHYDPIEKDKDKQIVLDTERVKYWLDHGAIPSDAVSDILLRLGIRHKYAEEKAARRARARAIAKAKGKPFTKADRIALEKKAEEEKAKAEAEVKAKEDQAKKAEKAKEEQAKEAEKAQAKAEEAKAKAKEADAKESQGKAEETKEEAGPEKDSAEQ